MIYKQYGTTGIDLSAVGFGGMRFDMKKSLDENAQLLLHARDKGINYFDTAPDYSDDKSEDIFGIAIEQMQSDRDNFYVSTKAMPLMFDTAEKAIAQVEKSLKRLKTDRIDFFHVWCIRNMDQYRLAMKPGGQYEGLLKCKEQGKIGNIVVSSHLTGSEITGMMADDNFRGVLLGVNILNFMYRWEGVSAAHKAGYGVVAMNPLSGGLIPKHEDALSFLAGPNETPTEAAIRFCVSCPEITSTLIGFTTTEHIDMACKIADNCREFSAEDLGRIRLKLSQNMDKLCTSCGYCTDKCPEKLPIVNYMQVYNERYMGKVSDEKMVEQLKFHTDWGVLANREAGAKDCVVCGKCETACTQHLDIMERLKQLSTWEAASKSAK